MKKYCFRSSIVKLIKSLSITAVLFFSLLSGCVYADVGAYQVNMIIFKPISLQKGLLSEHWSYQLQTPSLKGVVELNSNSGAMLGDDDASRYPLAVSQAQFGLQDELVKLKSSGRYEVLGSYSWIQDKHSQEWVHIVGGQLYDQLGNVIEQSVDNTGSDMTLYNEINGKVRIKKNGYYIGYFRLYLTEPESLFGVRPEKSQYGDFKPVTLTSFLLTQSRRMKLDELNYLDHPLMGVLVKITPFSAP